MGGNRPEGLKLYNFVDNHDVERIYTKLTNKAHFAPVHILLYTLPGVPSIYYGSEFAIEGKKERGSDASLRPALNLDDFSDALSQNPCTRLIARLGAVRQETPTLSYGDYRELLLTNRQYAFSRNMDGVSAIVTVNNDDSDFVMTVPAGSANTYIGKLSGETVSVVNGNIVVNVRANSGDIWVPQQEEKNKDSTEVEDILEPLNKPTTLIEPEKMVVEKKPEAPADTISTDGTPSTDSPKTFEEGRIAGLQEAIIAIMESKGPVTEQMRKDVYNQTHYPSLINWIKSF